jgi:hypothetical protein
MGVDITIFLEYWDIWEAGEGVQPWANSTDPAAVVWNVKGVHSLTDDNFGIGRNYQLFGALAGIRTTLTPLFAPRGLPPIVSEAVARGVMRYIHADDVPDEEVFASDGVHYSKALEKVSRGSRYGGPLGHKRYDYITEEVNSPSWLYLDEVDAALKHHGIVESEGNFLFEAMMSAMRTLERRLGQHKTRLVFWFG